MTTTTNWSDEQVAPMNTPPSMPPVVTPNNGESLPEILWKPGKSLPRAARYAAFLFIGSAITVAVAVMMHGMIKYRKTTIADDIGFKNASFIRLKQDSTVNRRQRKMPKKVIQKAIPKTPTLAVKSSQSTRMSNLNLKIDIPNTPSMGGTLSMMGGGGVGRGSNIRDAEYMPIFRTKPMYPPEAHEREVEGWVDVRYTVNKQGKIVNPKVVKANPPSLFNRAALQCVKRWKYRPKMRDGKTVATPNVQTRITFSLRDVR